jgi:hypothetical protein
MDRLPVPPPKGDRASTVEPASTVGRPLTVGQASAVQRASVVEQTSTSHQASSVPQARTQHTSFTSGINQTQHQFQESVSHSIPSAQHPSLSNIMKTSYLSPEQTQVRGPQQRWEVNPSKPQVLPATQQNYEIVQRRQLAALDRLYFSSGQQGQTQVAGTPLTIPQNANADGQPLNAFDTAAGSVPMMRPTQSGSQMQVSMELGNTKSWQGPDRAEEAIRNVMRMSPPYSTQKSNFNTQRAPERSQNPSLLALLGARQVEAQGQPLGDQLRLGREQVHGRPIDQPARSAGEIQARQRATRVAFLDRQCTQVPGMRGASQGSGQNLQSINPAIIYGHRPNPFPAQQFSNAPVQIPPSLVVTQDTRSVLERSEGTSLESTRGYHSPNPRSLSWDLATSPNVASTAHSHPQPRRSMDPPPVTPNAKRPRPDASGSTSRAGPSQNLRQQTPSSLATMGHPVPVLSAIADVNSNLQQRQDINQQPDGVLIMPGQYTPIPVAFSYAVSSPPAQGEQGSRTTSQSGSSPGFKTRVTIAISGCPASGKSTLAYLLAAVFEGATIPDTGFAGAQTMYPVFNGRVEENPNRKGPITKVIVIHQNSYIKPIDEWPIAEWTELYPYSPAMEVMNPQTGAARAFADERGHRSFERYWEEAYKANVGVDPSLVSSSSSSCFPQFVPPSPIRMAKTGPNLDCRGAIAWTRFGKAINDGMRGHKNEEGSLETEEGRDRIASYLSQLHPKTRIPLVNSRNLEPLRERIREWIREETAQNDGIGFPGRSVVDGSLRQMFILDGSLLFLQTDPNKGAGGERLMKTCDVKLFLPTLETEAIQRCFGQREYIDPPRGTRKPEQTWMYEGYFSEVAW